MIELTIGYVAGLIALATFVVQLWSPNTLAFILAGILKDDNNAVTWSVAGRALQSSYWPDLLRTETARMVGVRLDVILLTKMMRVMAILVAVAGTITPLGLHEQLVPAKAAAATFQYLKDISPYGLGTPPRSGLPLARKCDQGFLWGFPMPCPYSDTVVVYTSDGDTLGADLPYSYDTAIPDYYKDVFSSGTSENTTVSNFFDIQWRQWTTRTNEFVNNGSFYPVSSYRPMQSMVLNNATEAVEGLVVDTIRGGIGFRNHTAPLDLKHGATWTEDLLYVEPETSCININLTIDFTIASDDTASSELMNLVLTDRGGFANLNTTYPYYDRNDSQQNPDLAGRAYKGAWLNNAYTMLYLNVTNENNSTYGNKSFSYMNSYVGKTFSMPHTQSDKDYLVLHLSSTWGGYLSLAGTSFSSDDNVTSYKNPFRVTTDDFSSIDTICQGIGKGDTANITNIFGACGLMYGAAKRADGHDSLTMDAGSNWTVPLYSCASVVKATIKETTFVINGTKEQGLNALSVKDIQPKRYVDNASKPLWGVEDSGWNYTQISPIWGLISDRFAHSPNISSVRKESLYLPGGVSLGSGIGYSPVGYQNMPGTDFYIPAMGIAYGDSSISSEGTDYTGWANMGMHVRWKQLSVTPETAGRIIDLIWTDSAAAAVVGTKGALGPMNTGTPSEAQIKVQAVVRRIRYRWPFAIPALILLGLVAIITFIALVVFIFHHANISTLRQHLFRTSAGRIYTVFMFPDYADLKMGALDWRRAVGREMIDLGDESVRVTSIAVSAASKSVQSPYEGSNLMPYEGT